MVPKTCSIPFTSDISRCFSAMKILFHWMYFQANLEAIHILIRFCNHNNGFLTLYWFGVHKTLFSKNSSILWLFRYNRYTSHHFSSCLQSLTAPTNKSMFKVRRQLTITKHISQTWRPSSKSRMLLTIIPAENQHHGRHANVLFLSLLTII